MRRKGNPSRIDPGMKHLKKIRTTKKNFLLQLPAGYLPSGTVVFFFKIFLKDTIRNIPPEPG
jgi:hypothetical protein